MGDSGDVWQIRQLVKTKIIFALYHFLLFSLSLSTYNHLLGITVVYAKLVANNVSIIILTIIIKNKVDRQFTFVTTIMASFLNKKIYVTATIQKKKKIVISETFVFSIKAKTH